MTANGLNVDETIRMLANKPSCTVIAYSGYLINGFNFATRDQDSNRVTQNNWVNVSATTLQVSSSKDKNPSTDIMEYYGVLVEIWELQYLMVKKAVFKCDWVDSRWVKVDDLGFTVVDFNQVGHKSACFILASHAKQVFYVQDQVDPTKSIVCSVGQRVNKSIGVDGSIEMVIHEPLCKEYPSPKIDMDKDDVGIYERPSRGMTTTVSYLISVSSFFCI